MARRDMPVGAYVPGDSVLHSLDARVKVTLLLALTVAAFAVESLPALIAMLLTMVIAARACGLGMSRYARVILPLVAVFIIMMVANSIRFDGSGDIRLWGQWGFSLSGLIVGVRVILQMLVSMHMALTVSSTTTNSELSDALASLMSPLARIGVPVDDIVTLLSIALRFIPLATERLSQIKKAQRARGARLGEGSIVRRVLSWVPLLIPLVVGLFRKSEALADAMRSRCYRGWGRTRLNARRLSGRDALVLAFGILVALMMGVWL